MRSTRSTSVDGLQFVTPLILLWLLPVLALVLVIPAVITLEGDSVATELPTTVTVGSRENDYRQSVTATFAVTEPAQALLPGDGLVTAVHAVPGQVLVSADTVVSIDGATLRAHVDAQPFYRDIGPETRGADLEQLRSYLDISGIAVELGSDSSFTPSLARGISSYQEANGFPEDGTFRPSYVVYVPPEATEVQTVLVSPGALVAAGDPVLSGAVRPVSLTLSADTPLRLAGTEGPFAVTILDGDIPLTSLVPPHEEVIALHRALVAAEVNGGPPAVVEGATLSFSGLMLHLPSTTLRGTVPSTAVYTAVSGVQCVFRVTDPEAADGTHSPETATATPIDDAAPVEGEIGLSSVQADLIGGSVVRSPQSLPESVLGTCR